ncbi:MAG: hypothetical protein A2Z17_03990 [Gammaproteobacteria bacterium RBG_16_66_13]|nr:MAG: hypothetical protein A2Z17_03990 [Gammaproteobacteria bacterium RBG_16_66_13]
MSRTVVIRIGPAEQARRELRESLVAMLAGERVPRRREIWFPSLQHLASVLTERRLELLRLIHRRRPRSVAQLARLAKRGARAVEGDLRVLAEAGLVKVVATGTTKRPVAGYDRIRLAGNIPIARAAA